MNNNGVLSLGYTQRLQYVGPLHAVLRRAQTDLCYAHVASPNVTGSLGLALNTRGLQDASDAKPAHKFGMSMLFDA